LLGGVRVGKSCGEVDGSPLPGGLGPFDGPGSPGRLVKVKVGNWNGNEVDVPP